MNTRTALLAVLISSGIFAGCATAQVPTTVTETAARTPELSTFNRLIGEAGLAETLRGSGPYSVFAPSDDAFKAVPAATLDALGKDKERLKAVLTYHVIAGKVTSADVTTGPAKSVQGATLALAKAGTFVTVEDAVVTQADLPATNGVLHVIDRVLMPPASK